MASDAKYVEFCEANAYWLDDYALFAALKDIHGGASFDTWELPLKKRQPNAIAEATARYSDDIEFRKVLQFWFFTQWFALKRYANSLGIKLIGDLPIYIARDSADLWASPKQFALGRDGSPSEVAGCPPDGFSADGQVWGNPLYSWKRMEEDGFDWWTKRVKHSLNLFDVIRIDHFRGFDSYWCIPAGDKTAANGKWRKGPGMKLFDTLTKKLGKLPIIAEDLGFLTPSVLKLLKDSGYPGMKVLQFAFDPEADSLYLPHKYDSHCVVYTGTHDNDTIMGWFNVSGAKADCDYAKAYLRLNAQEGLNWGMMKSAMASAADTCILTMQDILGLDERARMNKPSTFGGNWQWRITPGCVNDWLANVLLEYTEVYHRNVKKNARGT